MKMENVNICLEKENEVNENKKYGTELPFSTVSESISRGSIDCAKILSQCNVKSKGWRQI